MTPRLAFAIALILLALYSIPLFILDYALIKSDYFSERLDWFERLGKRYASEDLGLLDALRLLTAIGTAWFATYLAKPARPTQGLRLATILVGFVMLLLTIAIGSYYAVEYSAENVREGYSQELSDGLIAWAATRFRELLTLLGALIGIRVSK